MKVLGERVIVRTEVQDETVRPSGIVTVEYHTPTTVGEVIACVENPDVRVGDVVIFPPSAGLELQWEREPHLVLTLDDILAVYEGANV